MIVDCIAVIPAKVRRDPSDPGRGALEVEQLLRAVRPPIRIDHKRKDHAVQLMTKPRASESISATPVGRGTRSRTFQRGRVCSAEGCSTVLSRYNRRRGARSTESATEPATDQCRPTADDQQLKKRTS
jgi:hypothetical protein